jgi:hypothetical protein
MRVGTHLSVRWPLSILLVVLVGLAADRILLQRSVVLQVEPPPDSAQWAVEWRRPGADEWRGQWLDLDAATAADPDSSAVEAALPRYDLADLRLRWRAEPGSVARIAHAAIRFHVLGLTVLERPCRIEPGDGATVSGDRATASDRAASVLLAGPTAAGFGVHASVALLVAAALSAAAGAVLLLRLACRARAGPGLVVAAVVILVNLLWAPATPCFVTGDGPEYIDAADWIATTGSTAKCPPFKAPGMSFVVAAAMLLSDNYLLSLGLLHALMGIATAWMAFALLRDRVPRPWALAAALLVGLHPVLLTYQCYVLRETSSAMVVMMLALGLARLAAADQRPGRRAALAASVLLGLIIAIGAYLRENFQLFAIFVPLGVLAIGAGRTPLRQRLARAGIVASVAVILLLPWAVRNWVHHDAFGIVWPKTQVNRLIAAWWNGVADGNDTAVLSHDQWQSLRAARRTAPVTAYGFLNRAVDAEVARRGQDTPPSAPLPQPDMEALSRRITDEAVSRRPTRAAWAVALAVAGQLGLWNLRDVPGAPENDWFSKPLRGEPMEFSTNLFIDPHAIAGARPDPEDRARLRDLLTRCQVSITGMNQRWWVGLFHEAYQFSRAARPLVAVAFLLGIVLAWRRGDRDLAVAGAATVACVLAAAVVVAIATDRYGVPFLPLMLCLAVYAVAALVKVPRVSDRCPDLPAPVPPIAEP